MIRATLLRRSAAAHWTRLAARRSAWFGVGVATAAAATGTAVLCFPGLSKTAAAPPPSDAKSAATTAATGGGPPFDYKAVRAELSALIGKDYSYGSLFVRLAWHEAASWDKNLKNGAPNTASMRFEPECSYGGNKGLQKARDLLEPIKKRHPTMSYADLWVLAAVVAVDEMGGPAVPFRYGRVDAASGAVCAEARLPDAAQTQSHVRDVFAKRLGFSDAETVALIGAHSVGECHAENSGFVGPWTHDRYGFDNSFFTELLENDWILDLRYPKLQFTDSRTRKLMMLPSDVALLLDPEYKKWVAKYAADGDLWLADFAKAFQKLLELGTQNLKQI